MKYIYVVIIQACVLLMSSTMYAQSQAELYRDVREDLDEMFINLDKSRVPTGYLLDYAVDLVDMSIYSGDELTDENYVDISIYQDVLSSIHSASLYGAPFGNPVEIIRDFQSLPDVSISMAAFKYNYIRSNALDDNLINYNESTGRVTDRFVGNNWVDPYVENVVFCFVPNKVAVTSLTVSFKFPDAYTFTNLEIAEMFFDPGDGNGFRPVSSSSPIDVTYSSFGEKELLVQVYTADGYYFCEAHSKIIVCEENALDIPTKSSSTTTLDDKAYFCVEYDGEIAKAQMSCYYIPGNTGITKPFIVAEGFDPWIFNYMLDDIPRECVHLGFTSHDKFYENWKGCVLYDKYDLVYVDWDNSLVDIRANAELLVQIIERINQMKAESGSSEKNVVMGQSMGGLVARYALRCMEIGAKPHETSTFISHDAPHLGANVPLGALYFIRQAISFAHGFDVAIGLYDLFANNDLTDSEKKLYSVLNAQSVRQMLVNYVNDIGGIDNSVHDSWQQTLEIYGFPTSTENIAIINGRQYDISNTLGTGGHLFYLNGYAKTKILSDIIGFLGGAYLFPLTYYSNLLGLIREAVIFMGSIHMNIHAEINPLLTSFAGNAISILNVNYVKRFLWLFPKTYNLHSSAFYAPHNELFYDEFPGSQYSFEQFEGPKEVIDTIYNSAFNYWGEYSFDFRLGNKIMFIPTASALAINSNDGLVSSQYMRDYFNAPPVSGIETPFNAYALAATSEEHIHINNNVFNWLDTQLHAEIDGPDTLSSSANYTMSGYAGQVQWKISDNSKAIIDDNGRLTAIGRGSVKITAESYINGQLIRKAKNVMIGMPDLAISYNFSPGSGHSFQMTAPDSEDADLIDELVKAGYFKYEWSILCDNEDMISTVGTNRSIAYLPEEDETVTVCLRLVDNNGNKSDTYSRTIDLQNPFSINYKYVEVSASGSVRFITENGYEAGVPSEDLMITFRNIIYSSDDNIFYLMSKYIQGNECYLAYPNGMSTTYLEGTKLMAQNKWIFTFFDTQIFADALQYVLDRAGGSSIESGEIVDFNISICNKNKKLMQRIPFAIIYKSL